MAALTQLIKSGLKATVQELPEDFAIKAESVPNMLAKKGVKAEEVEFAKIGLQLPKTGKVTKDMLEQAEAGRADVFTVEEPDLTNFNWVSLPRGANNPTYRERIYTFNDKYAKEFIRYFTEHFVDTPNYLMHTRVYDDTLDDVQTRVVQEIQSDLHQAGRQHGYSDKPRDLPGLQKDLDDYVKAHSTGDDDLLDSAVSRLDARGVDEDLLPDGDYIGAEEVYQLAMKTPTPPTSPHEKTWLRKGLERELAATVEEGRAQMAVPISGGLGPLQRADGVQKWYETTVLDTMRKLAKSQGMDFELKTMPGHGTVAKGSNITGPGNEIIEMLDGVTRGVAYSADEVRGVIADALPSYTRDELGDQARLVLMNIMNGTARWAPGEARDAFVKATQEATAADVTYAIIKPKPGGKTPSFSLYASPAAATMTAYLAYKEGYSQEDVVSQLTEQGYEADELQAILADVQKVDTLKREGYTNDEIKELLESQEVQVSDDVEVEPLVPPRPADPDNKRASSYSKLMGAEGMTIKELVNNMEVTYPDTTYLTTAVGSFFGNEEAAKLSAEAANRSRQRIVDEAHGRGLDLEWSGEDGEWYAHTDDGKFLVTPEWYKSFWTMKGELTGAIAGGIYGANVGARAGTLVAPELPVISQLIGGGLGSIIGAVGGSVAGAELDYLHSAMLIQQDWESNVATQKAFNAAEASVIGDLVGLGLFKAGGKSYKAIRKAVDWIKTGDKLGAMRGLRETLFVTEEQAQEIVEKLSRVSTVAGDTPMDKQIAAVATTQPGAEALVQASAATDPTASRAITKAVSDRAQDVLDSTKGLRGDDVGRWIREDLEGYRAHVKEDFTRVKMQAAASPRINNFSFNYDKLALEPVFERLGKNIENPDLLFKFGRQAQKIRDMSATRTLPDLLELRKLVNDFKFNKRISSAKDFDMLNEVLTNIDGAIDLGARVTIEKPEEWLAAWKASNKSYAQMKSLEANQLVKVLSRPGVTEKVIGDALVKYSGAVDSTFVDVLAQLPKKSRMRAEGAVLNTLAEKYTAGLEGGMRATNFPLYAKELQNVTFTSPEARSMKKAVLELSNVFMNDIPLAQATGNIQIPQFQSYLTADPLIRAKFEIASGVFNWVKTIMPTKSARSLALVRKTAQVLENPMNSKTVKELVEMLDGEVNIAPQLENMVKEATLKQAKQGDATMPRLRLYGDGKVLSAKGKGTERVVPIHRIASTDVIAQVAEATGINRADKKALDMALQERGYIAVQLGADKVRLINE
jgi:hypothetical protein